MKLRPHSPYHWILAALVAIAFLLALSEAHGQNGAAAMFEGRPAMAGAQGGLGAQAGVAQGSIGVQGNEATAAGTDTKTDKKTARKSKTAEVKPKRDPGVAKDQHSATRNVKRAVRNTISRARHGVSPVDSDVKEGAGRSQ